MKKLIVCIAVLLALCTAICCVSVACTPEEETDYTGLNAAREYLQTMLKNEGTVTGADFTRPAVLRNEHGTYTVTWTITVTSGSASDVTLSEPVNGLVTINVDEFASAEVVYTLTAVISDAEGNTVEALTYNHKVPAFVLNTYEEYVAACAVGDKNTIITVKGYVLGVNASTGSSSKGSLWIIDEDGNGYYAYKPTLDAAITESRDTINAAFPIGTEVVVKGSVTTYGGCLEYNDGCEIVFTGNSVDPATLPYVDVTELFGSAANMQDKDTLGATQSTRVTVKNVTMGIIDGTDNYDYHFTLNGVDFIFRMNNYLLDDAQNEELTAKWNIGGKANLTGIVNVYSNKYQIYPDSVDSIELIVENLTDAQKVEREKEILSLEAEYDANFTLPEASWADEIIWSVAGAGAVIGENNAVTINQTNEDQTVTFTATINCGEATDTATFTVIIKSSIIDWKTVEFAVTECAKLDGTNRETSAEEYFFYGIVGEIYNTEYCNFYLTDDKGNSIVVYGLYAPNGTDRYGSKRQIAEIPFQTGDIICMRGKLQNYTGTYEIINAVEVETPAKGSSIANPYTATDAVTECAKLDGTNRETSADTFVFVGTVGEIYNTEYCNFYLTDAENSIIVYGLYAPNGTDRYGSKRQIAEIPFEAGYSIVLTGKLQNYSGTYEIINAVLVSYEAPAVEEEKPTLETEFVTTSYADVAALVPNAGDNSSNSVYVIGYIKSIDNGTYGNLTLEDAEGNTLTIYGSYGFDGAVRFDKLPTKPVVGDVVVLYGKANNYNGTVQIKNGWIVQIGTDVCAETADYVLVQLSVESSATANFTLNAKATWSVKEGTGITLDGNNAVVSQTSEIQTVVLTASVTIAGETKTKDFTVSIPAALGAGQSVATMNFTAQGYANAQEVTSLTVDGITITFDKGTNNNTPKYYTSGTAVRVYGGGYFTISSDDATIVSVVITFGSSDGTNDLTADCGTLSNGAWTGSADSITFTVGGTTGNRRIMSIEITYEA